MNPKVENLIKKEKERLNASEKQIRNNHLISLGLIEREETTRVYFDYSPNTMDASYKYDEEKKKYYKEKITKYPIEVTEEEYAEICKYFPPMETVEKKRYPALRTIATILTIFAWVVGIVALIATIILVSSGSELEWLFAVLTLVFGGLIFLGLFAASESIKVNIDIEKNTKKTAEFINQKN